MAHIFAFEEIAEVVRLPSAQRTLDLLTLKVPQLVGLMKFANPEQNLTSILCPNLTQCLHEYYSSQNRSFPSGLLITHQSVSSFAKPSSQSQDNKRNSTVSSKCEDNQINSHNEPSSTKESSHRLTRFYICFCRAFEANELSQTEIVFPYGFMEYVKEGELKDKFSEASISANILLQSMKSSELDLSIPVLGIIMSKNQILYRLYHPSIVNCQKQIAEVDILWTTEVNSSGISRMIHMIANWSDYCTKFLKEKNGFPVNADPKTNVLITDDGWVYKIFDYRSNPWRPTSVPAEHQRSPEYYLDSSIACDMGLECIESWRETLSHGSEMKSEVESNFTLLRYRKIDGSHTPKVVGHLIQLLTKVELLHARGLVHGDIRLANILFSGTIECACTVLIDFDTSGKCGEKRYLPGFQKVFDGLRHKDALEGHSLQYAHDLAAVVWIFEQFLPVNEARSNWLLQLVHDPTFDTLRSLLERFPASEPLCDSLRLLLPDQLATFSAETKN
jgi:serine/threonine protein kinase